MQKSKTSASSNPSPTVDGNRQTDFDSAPDFDFTADPSKYLDEIEGMIRKNQDLSGNFQRFIQQVFDNTE